ncbi:MFS general substrate transporter [Purpureocillium lilacinum]|uniref:MFS general substrate transporter n=1 Tax=Purpureocillium lilacinum TaxID=33203 RepID=A0A179HRP6_PURLI|nr:MFS general substrate transporter [Purpureocillium lilacinum]OAQ92110.1 MFS general substrate transporter [Purpureocillium lilacinum]
MSKDSTTTLADQVPARDLVAARYHEAVKERQSNPDQIFYDAEDLTELDPNLVALSSATQENPRAWSVRRKWVVTLLTGTYCFLAPFASTIFAPSLPSMMADVGETDPVKGALQIAIFLLSFALAPIFLAPLSEIHGRRPILRYGNLFFAAFSLGSGFSQTTAQLSACRFLAGVGGSASMAVFGGVLSDVWPVKDRARASAILGTTLMLGPVLGPACGGWMSERASWRWTCWVPVSSQFPPPVLGLTGMTNKAMAAVGLELVSTFAFYESYIPSILTAKVKRLRKEQSNPDLYTVMDIDAAVMYLVLDPALALLSLYYAVVFGILYLIVVTFQFVFGQGYGHSPGVVGMDLITEGVGAFIGMFTTAKLLDIVYRRQIQKKEYKSETRLISAFPGAIFVSTGLFIYGFTALRTHFVLPLIGMLIFSFGMTNTYLAIQLYIIDSFDYPASAIAGLSVLRCLFAAVFPLFGPRLIDSLGVDWGMALLGFISLGLGLPFLPLIYHYGPRLRAVGKRNRTRLFG